MAGSTLKMPRTVCGGENAVDRIGEFLGGRGEKAALFTDRGVRASGAAEIVQRALRAAGVCCEVIDDLPSEPTCDEAQAVVDRFLATGARTVVAAGGGSVMDVAKLASIAGGCGVRALLDDPRRGRRTARTVMIPTTAGTGAEATPNSIVAVPERELKVGIVNDEMIADVVLLDGRMIRKLPAAVAAATGIDALSHAVECYTSKKACPMSDLFALEALRLIFANIERACADPDAAREKDAMLLAAFYGGVAITSSGTTAVHALSYPLGGRYHIAHGVSNAMLLMPVMRYNRDACLDRLAEIGARLGPPELASPGERADWALGRMESIVRALKIPTSLKPYGVGEGDLDDLVAAGMDVQRLLVNNRRTVTPEDARALYREIL